VTIETAKLLQLERSLEALDQLADGDGHRAKPPR
jgi:hypothetical protein